MLEDMKNKLSKARELDVKSGYLTSLHHLFMWDLWTGVPSKGREYREKLAAYIASEQYKNYSSKEAKDLIDYFEGIKLSDEVDEAIIRELKRNYEFTVKIPYQKHIKLESLCTTAQIAWKEAFEKSDFNIYKPYLKQVVDLNKEITEDIGYEGSRMNAILKKYEPDLSIEQIESLFLQVKNSVLELLTKIKDCKVDFNDELLSRDLDKKALISFCKYIVEEMGYDIEAGGYGEALHPFTSFIGPKDARFTNNYCNFKSSVFSALHEVGHAMYAQNSDEKLKNTSLWGGIMGSIHESQGRFFENILGRSKEFWLYFYPRVQEQFKEFRNLEFDEFYKSVNFVEPSLIRTDADELTYNIHPIIRFEIEKDLFDEKIKFDDLPEIWNEKYKEYLGIKPKNDREGILQDIHWSMGLFGYFQSYTLGNIYGGQFFHKLNIDEPYALKEIESGNFEILNTWQREKIYKPSKIYTSSELIKNVTDEELSARYFIEYLNEKYSEIYSF